MYAIDLDIYLCAITSFSDDHSFDVFLSVYVIQKVYVFFMCCSNSSTIDKMKLGKTTLGLEYYVYMISKW